MLHKARIAGLTIDPTSNTPIIILKTEESEQAIPIWIGLLEATSIASALQNIEFERPMTHDLFKNLTDYLKIEVTKVEVCDLRDNTFFALIHFLSQAHAFTMDARLVTPSLLHYDFRHPSMWMIKLLKSPRAVKGMLRLSIRAKKEKNGPNIWKGSPLKILENTKCSAFFHKPLQSSSGSLCRFFPKFIIFRRSVMKGVC